MKHLWIMQVYKEILRSTSLTTDVLHNRYFDMLEYINSACAYF